MAKYLTKVTQGRKGVDKLQSILGGRVWQQEPEAAGYSLGAVRKQLLLSSGSLLYCFLQSWTQAHEVMPPTFRLGLPSSQTSPGNLTQRGLS